jgi:hypothetical protein
MKVLHLSFHKGCINDINFICNSLNIDCEVLSQNLDWNTNKNIPTLFEYNDQHYNITKELAIKYWNTYSGYFNTFDCIITSDTAPLSRIFLQNNSWKKKLIIWVCNRFNYANFGIHNKGFPDEEYYTLFREALTNINIHVIAYTQFEIEFCKLYNINIPIHNLIKPSGGISVVYSNIDVYDNSNTLFIVPYHNETNMMNLQQFLQNYNINCICKKYNGPFELKSYKAVIHIPYALSNLALFEIFQLGIIYFIPSFEFLLTLNNSSSNFWFQDKSYAFKNKEIIEWYNPLYNDLFIYFDSWSDFVNKYNNLDTYIDNQRDKILRFGKIHMNDTLDKWIKLLL